MWQLMGLPCPRPMESIGDPMESELSVVEFIIFYIILDI